jgi:hypothetical protein
VGVFDKLKLLQLLLDFFDGDGRLKKFGEIPRGK